MKHGNIFIFYQFRILELDDPDREDELLTLITLIDSVGRNSHMDAKMRHHCL